MTDDYPYDKLAAKFPNLYKNKTYIECGPGWYQIIYDLSAIIEKDITTQLDCLGEKNPVDFIPYATQVKEKFGELRFYMSCSSEYIEGQINRATAKSRVTCEVCGKPGTILRAGWLSCLCPEHRERIGE